MKYQKLITLTILQFLWTLATSAPVAPITGHLSVCQSATSALADSSLGGTWGSSDTTIASINAAGMVTAIAPGTALISYYYGTYTATAVVTVNPLPGAISGSAFFCVGTSTSYLYSPTSGGSWTSGSLSVATVDPVTGYVTGIASGFTAITYTMPSGCAATHMITVAPGPSANLVTGGGNYCSGGAGVAVGLDGSSTGVVYQMYSGTATIGAPVPGTGSPISFGLQTAGSYSVVATNTITGCSASMTGSATSTAIGLPATFPVTGGGSYCPGGAGVNVSLFSSQPSVNYQLYKDAVATGASVSGTGAGLSFGNQTNPGTYTVVGISVTTGCANHMTGTPVVSLYTLPAAYSVSGGGAYCAGGAGSYIGLSGSSSGISYQLMLGGSPAGSPATGTGSPVSFGVHTGAGIYSVVAINTTTGCTSAMTGTATVTINSAPPPYNVTGGGGFCAGGPGADVQLDGSNAGMTYQLLVSGAPVGAAIAGTGTTLDFGLQSITGTYLVIATNAVTGCSDSMHGSANVYANPLPVAYTVMGGGGYCAGAAGAPVELSGSAMGTRYVLFRGAVAIDTLNGTGSSLNFGLQTATDSFTATGINTTTHCTASMAGRATVYIDPLPSIYAVTGGGAYCSGGTGVHIGLSISDAGTNYNLYHSGTLVTTVAGSGSALDFGLQTATGYFTATATNASTLCISHMADSANVTITPGVIPAITFTSAPGDTVCSGAPVIYTSAVTNGGATPLVTWRVNGTVVVTGSVFSYVPANGDVVSATLHSSAACALPDTANLARTMTVHMVPAIAGASAMCVGSVLPLTDTLLGGTWHTADTAIAAVGTIGVSTGEVTGLAAGIARISYTLSASGCMVSKSITVNASPTVSAPGSAQCGGNYAYTAAGAATYTWSPATGISCATCASVTINPPATTTYTVTGTSAAGCSGQTTVTVDGNRISGFISYSGTPADTLKVWLIQFRASDSSLIALDSAYTCMDGGTPYFEFDDKPAGNYMVKARLLGTVPGTSGYIPTYSLSTPYWYAASSTAHTNATDTMHINMIYGIVPAGPGFIGGLISAGAGRGTSGDVPAAGMLVYLADALSDNVITYTYTDSSGAYAFSNLGPGNYQVYPEQFSFTTVPSAPIVIGAATDSAMAVDFRQFNNSRIIKPVSGVTGIAQVPAQATGSFDLYPNPSGGMLFVSTTRIALSSQISITDVTGRTVYSSVLSASDWHNGTANLDMSHLQNGMYIVTITDETQTWSSKLEIRR